MYVQTIDLGRFEIPEVEDWPLQVRYIPEPPLLIRGAMNPWELEKKRELWMKENEAWKQIQALQSQYRSKLSAYNERVSRFNQLIGEIEHLTGKKGLQRIMGSKGFQAASLAITTTNPYGAIIAAALVAVSLLETGFKILSGEARRKKKRLKELTNALEQVGKEIEQLTAQLSDLARQIMGLTTVREQVKRERKAIDDASNALMIEKAKQQDATTHTAGAAYAARVNALRQSAGKKVDYGTL